MAVCAPAAGLRHNLGVLPAGTAEMKSAPVSPEEGISK